MIYDYISTPIDGILVFHRFRCGFLCFPQVVFSAATHDQIKLKREYDEGMGRENQGEDQGERIPSDSVKTQTTRTLSDSHRNTNKSDHSTTTQIYPNLVESGVKKGRKSDENYMEKLKKQPSFYVREGEVRSAYLTNKPMILLVYKEAYFNTNDLVILCLVL